MLKLVRKLSRAKKGESENFELATPTYPSELQNRCNAFGCHYNNGPQTMPGTFQCKSRRGTGRARCKGTYTVTERQARQANGWLREHRSRPRASTEGDQKLDVVESHRRMKSMMEEKRRVDEERRNALGTYTDATHSQQGGAGSRARGPGTSRHNTHPIHVPQTPPAPGWF